MGRLLVDATDLVSWSGTHGGVQRVVYAVTKELFLSGRQAVYIAFDASENRFYVIDFQAIYDRVENTPKTPQTGEGPLARKTVAERIYTRMKRNRIASAAARPVKAVIKRYSPTTDTPPSRDWVAFAKEDDVLILGMAWENLNIQRVLGEQRKSIGFHLIQLVYDLCIVR